MSVFYGPLPCIPSGCELQKLAWQKPSMQHPWKGFLRGIKGVKALYYIALLPFNLVTNLIQRNFQSYGNFELESIPFHLRY